MILISIGIDAVDKLKISILIFRHARVRLKNNYVSSSIQSYGMNLDKKYHNE
ncbi:MAG: hypothetical protein Dasosvirus4_13 [Dasosvirus sp.]|uniref:Uncharacterized protein n=1 Tax=Dasosvirus sp. TaxID=2487764 RepID=A0A3G4ZRE9_9VIRU|nr:MAG: hypothetical protein Dasosvirus4_13 [Dasosvirus sp.]